MTDSQIMKEVDKAMTLGAKQALDRVRAEIDRQEKWLLQAGYTAYNVDLAFDAIKAAAERERYGG